VTGPDDLSTIVGAKRPGERVKLDILRDGRERSIEVTLDDRPATAPANSSP
jgi:S1-C subfamily serine protease